jgi:hypothetical protein
VGESGFRLREFSRKDTALLLGISESYLGTLEIERGMHALRNERGQPVYTAADIAILRSMGVGKGQGRLYSSSAVIRWLGLYYFGRVGGDPEEAKKQAIAAKGMQEREVERLRILRDEAWRRKVQGWRG